jgi:hypothetical protein
MSFPRSEQHESGNGARAVTGTSDRIPHVPHMLIARTRKHHRVGARGGAAACTRYLIPEMKVASRASGARLK